MKPDGQDLLKLLRQLRHGPLGRFWIRYRATWSVLWYATLAAVSLAGAFLLRFEGAIPWDDRLRMFGAMPVAMLIRIITILYFEVARGLPRYIGFVDLIRILKAATAASVCFIIMIVLIYGHGFPRSVFIIDYLLTVALYGGTRVGLRFLWEMLRTTNPTTPGRNTLILGAGSTGEMAVQSIENDFYGVFSVVGFLDDNPAKQGMTLHGYPILGPIADAPRFIQELSVREVIIAIPRAGKDLTRRIVEKSAGRNISFHIVPPFQEVIGGRGGRQRIRDVSLEDLLGRDPVRLDPEVVRNDLAGRRVLITGAGGSIGSELARQIAQCEPGLLLLLDCAETPLFEIGRELAHTASHIRQVELFADIKHGVLMDKLFAEYRPERVFHAAAYKHVPMNESHPVEAVFNNIFGTRNLLQSAMRHGVEKFVMISTDKAVRPASVMGATKRCAELLVQHMNGNGTRFVVVRFGNVLGSAGSVVPLFQKQIASGGPVTVTHMEVERYFMTVPEAVELVLQAGAIGQGGEAFILDMGMPVRIVDLARHLVELSGLELGKDIQVQVTALRPGEKLQEELVADGEDVTATQIPKVMIHRTPPLTRSMADLLQAMAPLEAAAMANDDARTREELWQFIRRFDGPPRQAAEPKA